MADYYALALQVETRAVNQRPVDEARAMIMAAIERISGQISATKRFLGQDLKLVVLPEYALTGFPWGDTPEEWLARAAVDMHGREYDALAKAAEASGVFIVSNLYERDPNFPHLYFQANVIVSPSGEQVLRYRRLISMFAPSPFDIWDAYLDIYGAEAILPVCDTEIGKLGTIASEEILYPEIARCLASKGAEVLLHPTSEVSSPLPTPKSITRHARAVENMAYVVSANSGGLPGCGIPENSTDGGSEIIDFKGRILARAGAGESINAFSEISLAELRAYRQRPGMGNLLSRHPMEIWAGEYARFQAAEKQGLGDGKAPPERSFFLSRQQRVIRRLSDSGLI